MATDARTGSRTGDKNRSTATWIAALSSVLELPDFASSVNKDSISSLGQ
jgi:hypothetical protein